ncbi:MAG: hypothetical protein CMA48_00045 [Euryarchaeota archaeon]|nr:hypothetical protein [Euryarchaeota archaeon]|tara:strand:+ start:1241 stop:2161 length:921 start_codon:yes stop_codon:yes gene_type:complete
MSKIKLSEVEALSTNGDLELTPNGTGTVEISNDEGAGVLQLNSSPLASSKIKLKSPPESAAQNYTLILPDNQVAQDKYLQVASVTGSGSTAVGQLEYATVTAPNINLDASNITSGTVPKGRIATPLSGSLGLGMQHINTSTIASGQTAQSISFENFETNATYRIYGSLALHNYHNDRIRIRFLDTSNAEINSSSDYMSQYIMDRLYNPNYYYSTQQDHFPIWFQNQNNYYRIEIFADITTKNGADSMFVRAFESYSGYAYQSIQATVLQQSALQQIGGVKFYLQTNQSHLMFGQGSSLSLYKYVES